MGTHDVVWEALAGWSADQKSASLFVEMVKIKGVNLKDCLDAIWPGISIQSVASQIVRDWGLDLKRGVTDRSERNVSSYTPHALNPINPPAASTIDFVSETWHLFEPASGSSFDGIDRFLLRSLLRAHHRRVFSDTNYVDGPISRRYDYLLQSIKLIASKGFLDGSQPEDDPKVLSHASANSNPASPIDMLSRAFLLVRAASAFTHSSLTDAGINFAAGDMRPWIDQWAEDRGFWSPATKLEDPADLWADVELALIDLDESRNPAPATLNEWLQKTNKGLPTISEAERVGVWSLSA